MRLAALGLVMAWAAQAAPTFTKDVAPILYRNCVACHRPGEVAPMSLLDYKSARPWAKAIREAVLKGKMPPWFADPKYGHFSNDARLSAPEIETLTAWADAGAPEGELRDLPPQPVFQEGWRIGKPDVIIDIGQDFLVKKGIDRYEYFVVPTNFKEGVWIRAAEIRPGNRQVVHHVHAYLLQQTVATGSESTKSVQRFMAEDDGLTWVRADAPVVNDGCASGAPDLPNLAGVQEGSLAAFLPGRQPDVFPEGSAKWIPPGTKLRFQIHYARTDKPQTDRTSIGLFLAPGPPERVLRRMDMRNFFFQIPPRVASHEVTRCYDVESDRRLVAITPHMHYRGKEAQYEVVHPDGRREILLSVPHYSFEWQLNYRFQDPVLLEKGSRLQVTFRYDNSPNNPANPDPNKTIRWGDKSEEEMMTSWIEYFDASGSRAAVTESARKE